VDSKRAFNRGELSSPLVRSGRASVTTTGACCRCTDSAPRPFWRTTGRAALFGLETDSRVT